MADARHRDEAGHDALAALAGAAGAEGPPLRGIKRLADEALAARSPTFDAMYSRIGRPSVPPERLLKATVLMALDTVRSERLFCEQLDDNLLFRWFLDMHMMEPSFDHRVFSVNRQRLLAHDVTGQFFAQAQAARLMSAEHVTVDGTLIEVWASLKRVRPKGEPPEARLARKGKGKEAKLAYGAHALMEHRHGLLVDLSITSATDTTEPDAALALLDAAGAGERRVTVSGDKGYDTRGFVDGCRARQVTPHVAQNLKRNGGSAIDGRTTRHPGYALSQRFRKRVEEIVGWMKTVGGFRRTRYTGQARTPLAAYLVGAAYIHPAAHGAASARDGVTGQGSVRTSPQGPLAGGRRPSRRAPRPSTRGQRYASTR